MNGDAPIGGRSNFVEVDHRAKNVMAIVESIVGMEGPTRAALAPQADLCVDPRSRQATSFLLNGNREAQGNRTRYLFRPSVETTCHGLF
jgi:hypothetical protein